MMNLMWSLAILFLYVFVSVHPSKVLVVFPITGKSHSILGDGVVKELIKRGHEVTYITAYPKKDAPANLTQIDISFVFDLIPANMLNVSEILEGRRKVDDIEMIEGMMVTLSELTLKTEAVQRLLLDTAQHFDLVVVEWFYTELYTGLAALYKCPLVWVSSMDVHSQVIRLMDEVPSPLLIQDMKNTYTPPFTFLQRVEILWTQAKLLLTTESYNYARESAYIEIFTPLMSNRGIELPQYKDILYNASLMLTNAHPSLGGAPRLPQNIKPVGGYHIEVPTKPLPKNLQALMDNSTNGVIYFSLGSNMKSKDLPEKIKTSLLRVFGRLNETVLWKFEEDIHDLPSNVHIQQWMPQLSILDHPNIKLFITHGGLLSTTEAVHFGVPVVGIPLFADQFINMERSRQRGFAVNIEFTLNLAEDLEKAINEVLGHPRYAETAKRLSKLYHARPQPAAAEMMFWLEYVVSTQGAAHLRSTALLWPWYQRLYLDVIACALAAVLVALFPIRRFFVRRQSECKLKND